MSRLTLRLQLFLSILAVSFSTALIVGLFARTALSSAFDTYLASLPTGAGQGRRMGRMMLGSAEQAFVSSVDRSVLIATVIAVVVAAAVAVALAAYLTRPIVKLESAAQGLAEGDLAHRVDVQGPAEVAALSEAFNSMADSLEQAEELRRRLVVDVAHELRNPLAAARAQAEGMVDGVLAVDANRLGSLLEDLQHLSALVDELQELAVAESGQLRYQMSPLDIVELARREAERVVGVLAPGVELVVTGIEEPCTVQGDAHRLGQVMRNLLSNAARHTSSGSITVAVDDADGEVTVSVADTGEGIPPHDIEHIFERFYRADTARAKATGGAGLGLAISRTIVRDHGGEIFARSQPGVGTTVGFTLPLPAPSAPDPTA